MTLRSEARDELKSYIERIERLADERKALGDAVRAVWDAVRLVAVGAPPVDLRKY